MTVTDNEDEEKDTATFNERPITTEQKATGSKNIVFCGFDTETTGIIDEQNPGEMVQIGLVHEQKEPFERHFMPECDFTEEATRLNGLSKKKLKA